MVRHSIFAFLTLLLACQIPIGASALDLTDQWRQLSPQEFEKYNSIFAPYDIKAHRNDIWVLDLANPKVMRIESPEFCRKSLCLTIVTLACRRSLCPSTAVFSGRQVSLQRQIIPFLGAPDFSCFLDPRSERRSSWSPRIL
jgi:hypothetical protein